MKSLTSSELILGGIHNGFTYNSFFMSRLFSRLHEGEQPKGPSRIMTASQFLGKDPNVKGVSTPEAFLAYGRSLREAEIDQLEQFFGFVKDGVRVIGSIVTRRDKGNRSYQHPNFLMGNATIGTKLILECGMREFLLDYIAGNVSISFTLEELIAEAMNS